MNNEYVVNVYGQRGDAILKILAAHRFQAIVTVRLLEPEPFCYGHYSHDTTIELSSVSTVSQAIEVVESIDDYLLHFPNLDRDECMATPVSFKIVDRYTGERILGGIFGQRDDKLRCLPSRPVITEKDREEVRAEVRTLEARSRAESYYDDNQAGRYLKDRSETLGYSLFSGRITRSQFFQRELDVLIS